MRCAAAAGARPEVGPFDHLRFAVVRERVRRCTVQAKPVFHHSPKQDKRCLNELYQLACADPATKGFAMGM